MRILFDHGTPSGIAAFLSGQDVTEAREHGWDRVSNGELLRVAEAAGFDVLLTTDKGIRYQQNLTGRRKAIVVLGNSTWPVVRQSLDRIALAIADAGQVCRSGYTLQVSHFSREATKSRPISTVECRARDGAQREQRL